MDFSAYVPCFNNQQSVGLALSSLQNLSLPPAELFLVDDCSSDSSCRVATAMGVPVIAMASNAGRGSIRARAMQLARHEFVVCCDATNELPAYFVSQALPWFDNPRVAAVFGRIWQGDLRSLGDRWRGRHLFKVWEPMSVRHHATLSTWGCVLRRSAVLAVGNFNPSLRHSEDADLGDRLLAAGFDVVFDPALHVISGVSNTPFQALDRFWRWNAGEREEINPYGYAKQVWYALRVLVPRDLRDGDLASVPLSLLCPHYQFWKSWKRRVSGRVQS